LRLTSDFTFWFAKNGIKKSYGYLDQDATCEVLVIGAGITGAMVAQRLARDGHAVIVLDKRDVCTGSTSASTALLQYEIDVSLVEMSRLIGRDAAYRAYRISHQSIDDLENLSAELNNPCEFQRKTSLYFAETRKAAKRLADEYRARRDVGLDITYHNSQAVHDRFGLRGSALLSSRQAASCDPYLFAHALLEDAVRHGARVFDRTEVIEFSEDDGKRFIRTQRGTTVRCQKIVIATGYEASKMIPEKVVNLDNTYAIISQPLTSQQLAGWDGSWMLWEAKEPYLYLRVTQDQRLLIGGEDDAFHSPAMRDACLQRKARKIERKFRHLVPGIDFEPEYAWAGTFGKTKDGLAYIGEHPNFPNRYFALGFGGNGITFSAIATKLIAGAIKGQSSTDQWLFRFGR
jgi:glycine/D-amino acid oxidase-like deaminating enzyme